MGFVSDEILEMGISALELTGEKCDFATFINAITVCKTAFFAFR